MNELRLATRRVLDLFGAGETEGKARLFAAHLDFIIIPAVDRVLESFGKWVDILTNLLDAIDRVGKFFKGQGQLSIPGGGFDIPDDFEPGRVIPGSAMGGGGTTIINVTDPIDPEGQARRVTRVIEQSRLRVGRVSPTQFVGGL